VAAQRGCAAFILGGFQDLARPSRSDLRADPALDRRLDRRSPEVPSNLIFPVILVSPAILVNCYLFLTISN